MWINAKYGLVNTNGFAGIAIIGGRIWAISERDEDGDLMLWETGDGGMNTPEEALGTITDGLVKARPVIDLLQTPYSAGRHPRPSGIPTGEETK